MNFSRSIYCIILALADLLMRLLRPIMSGHSKTKQYIWGTTTALKQWQNRQKHSHTLWVHCASLGELGVVRPIIRQLKQEGGYHVVLTFFSPTGVNALKGKCLPDIDEVGYLPLDTLANARKMIQCIDPEKVIFSVSEFWINYLAELHKKNVPTFLVGALLNGSEPHFKWYGSMWRRSLQCYKKVMVLDESSRLRLSKIGYHTAQTMGDPLFDNALNVAAATYDNPIVERFATGERIMVIGSLSDENDLQLTATLANRHRHLKLLIVPHETTPTWIDKIANRLDGKSLCYTKCSKDTDFSDIQALIIDYVGDLARLYRYGTWAYVGGGFTPYLHSVIEACVYGLPVAFGPRIERKATPQQMIDHGIGTLVETGDDLCRWYESNTDEKQLNIIKSSAMTYAKENGGATKNIIEIINQS